MIDPDENKVFCIAPWVHLHAWSNGAVYPCCLSNGEAEFQFGNLNKQSLDELFNSERIKEMRKDLISGKPHGACTRCYETEKLGFPSMRNNLNEQYYSNNRELVESTKNDGSLTDMKIRYWDIRFSNICNMKCRTCGPDFSTQWHSDSILLGHKKSEQSKVKKIRDSFLDETIKYISYIDQVYFAGGEPIIMDEHWKFVEQLVEHGDKGIKFFYQTNLSQLVYKGKSVIDLWNNFENVTVTASLDAFGDLAEYIRNGTDWEKIERNIRVLTEKCPHVQFNISCTVSILNVHHVVDFYNYLTNSGLIHPNNFEINPVMFPKYYRVENLPKKLLEKYKNIVDEHIEKLKKSNIDVSRTLEQFQSLSCMIDTETKYMSNEWIYFLHLTKQLDKIRNEDIKNYLPDLVEYL